jgi:hypothetical protein
MLLASIVGGQEHRTDLIESSDHLDLVQDIFDLLQQVRLFVNLQEFLELLTSFLLIISMLLVETVQFLGDVAKFAKQIRLFFFLL